MTSRRESILQGYDFALDAFQLRAIDALDAGRSVLVAAPTGSGKTVVAEYAVGLALAEGAKAFYTAPIKALSNQKYGDLARRHGLARVGLLTGDNSVNGDAPVVVMTTEVLRNMVYAAAPALQGLRYVVLDEVHYLQDAYRGPVWEEVILHLPLDVQLVCLSATVSNAEDLADWISTVRGPTEVVLETTRPVELQNLYCVGDRSSPALHLLPTLVHGQPNPEASRLDAASLRGQLERGRGRRRFFTPRRVEVVERLAEEDLLPAIVFIFSRAACDDAVRACIAEGVRLVAPDERQRIREVAERHVEALTDGDLDVLEYDAWLTGLELGVAAHHAGMVPPFKEAVEELFAAGLLKVVFATETLALGINMPARTVVIEKLSKFTGERHEFLTPGEYTQLTGRAGRRGLDPVGYAVVLWSPFVPFDQVASLASSRSFRLSSAFRPTYNMAANLVRRYEPQQAHHLLNLSFAQYQADQSVVRLEARIEKRTREAVELEAEAQCDRGDVLEYAAAVRAAEELGRARRSPRVAIADGLAALRPGDVIDAPHGRRVGPAAVLSSADRGGEPRIRVVTPHRKVLTLSAVDFDVPPVAIGEVEVPEPFAPNSHAFQLAMARRLQRVRLRPARRGGGAGDEGDDAEADPIAAAEAAVLVHPVHRCPEHAAHLRALDRADRARRDLRELRQSVKGRTESLARRFDRVLRVLEAWGHLDGWALTPKGERLRRIYHEADLLIAETLDAGLLDDLDPAALAGLVSVFTYEHRSSAPPPAPWFPSPRVRERFEAIDALAQELNADELDAGLPLTRRPDPGFVALAHAWAAGEALDEVLDDESLSGGDFVRNVKQLIDLLRQLATAAPATATARHAAEAAEELYRGVIAASSAITVDDEAVEQ